MTSNKLSLGLTLAALAFGAAPPALAGNELRPGTVVSFHVKDSVPGDSEQEFSKVVLGTKDHLACTLYLKSEPGDRSLNSAIGLSVTAVNSSPTPAGGYTTYIDGIFTMDGIPAK